MKNMVIIITMFAALSCVSKEKTMKQEQENANDMEKVIKTDEEWKEILPPLQYNITREKGTERPFTGEYYDFFEKGHYVCVACGNMLFDSETKFHSGCGWPSFNDVFSTKNIEIHRDTSNGMIRTEVTCARCGAHLGHVFNDGPPPTGLRYCMNSAAMKFEPDKE